MEFSCGLFVLRKRNRLRCVRVIGTLGFSSWSLVAAPGHPFPKAVWLLGARPSANTAPDGACRANPSKAFGFRKRKGQTHRHRNRQNPQKPSKIQTFRNHWITKPLKTLYRAKLARSAAGTQTIGVHRSLQKHQNVAIGNPLKLLRHNVSDRPPRTGQKKKQGFRLWVARRGPWPSIS